jgi:beta-phosphoglucomutase-like phosphatase (HAD superfamily)
MKYQGVIFDMDGVLLDATEWHYEALNEALDPFGFAISREQHLKRFDGLSTKKICLTNYMKLFLKQNKIGLYESQQRNVIRMSHILFY